MADGKPLLSIVTATYNAARDLPRLIESLVAQTDQDFEWVVADGVSTDGTLELLEMACCKLRHVVVDSRPDFGIYDALNRAVKLASGEYYLVVGADDILFPEAVERYKAACLATGADLVTAKVFFGDSPKPRGIRSPAWDFLWGQTALVSNHAVGLAIRRALHERFGYYSRKFPISADQLFIMQAVQGGARVAVQDFVAGRFDCSGTSGQDVLGASMELCRVQVLMGRSLFWQTVLLLIRLVFKWQRIQAAQARNKSISFLDKQCS
ncbi:MAG: glycosyltransferase [Gloeomargarita sp. SKYB31]|nr:glycosyltransferase [Gloeomargarita sp. SKYB31]